MTSRARPDGLKGLDPAIQPTHELISPYEIRWGFDPWIPFTCHLVSEFIELAHIHRIEPFARLFSKLRRDICQVEVVYSSLLLWQQNQAHLLIQNRGLCLLEQQPLFTLFALHPIPPFPKLCPG